MKRTISFFQSISFRIILSFVLLIIMALEVMGAFFIHQSEKQSIDAFREQIQLPANLRDTLATDLSNNDSDNKDRKLQQSLNNLFNNNIEEITVVDSTGTIRAVNTITGQQNVGNKLADSNVQNALKNNNYMKYREDNSNNQHYEYVTYPLTIKTADSKDIVGAVIIKANLATVYKNISDTVRLFILGSILSGLFATVLAIVLSKSLIKPIRDIKDQTKKITQGDYSINNVIKGHDELAVLANSVNELAKQIEKSTEEVNSERNRLDSVLTHMGDGVIAVNRSGEITIANEAASKMLDIPLDSIVGVNVMDVLNLGKDTTFRSLFADKDSLTVDLTHEDTELIADVYISVIKRQSGFISGLVMILHDITEQQRIDNERKLFVSNVSHELRTPLTSVKSYVDALSEGAIEDPEMSKQFLKVVQDETQRMIRMINDLLELSRLDNGTLDVKIEIINLKKLFNFVLDRFEMIIDSDSQKDVSSIEREKKNYHIIRECTDEDLWVEVDPDKLIQVLDNIMNNAVKYSPDGGNITARLIKNGNRAMISIKDEGMGIPTKDLKNVFNRFFRVDKARSRAQGGTGLGLAISKEIISAFNGRIWVESQEGYGSTFNIILNTVEYIDTDDSWD